MRNAARHYPWSAGATGPPLAMPRRWAERRLWTIAAVWTRSASPSLLLQRQQQCIQWTQSASLCAPLVRTSFSLSGPRRAAASQPATGDAPPPLPPPASPSQLPQHAASEKGNGAGAATGPTPSAPPANVSITKDAAASTATVGDDENLVTGGIEDEEFPPPRPSPSAPHRHLSLAAAKRILAPQLEPLAAQSPWQSARDELLASEEQAKEAAKAQSQSSTAAGTSTSASPASKAAATTVPLRRPYAFLRRLTHHWLHRLSSLLQYGLSSEDNHVRVYTDGDEAFQAMFDAIAAAQDRVYLETFMWKPCRVGLKLIQLMEEAADRGCQVLVLYDSAGSFSLRSSHLAKLKAKPSAHVFAFNPVLSALFRFSGKDMSHRTHRKILIADNLAFAGGMNSTEQYAGPRLGINEFRDTHARIRGPAVEHLTEVFFQSLQEAHAHDKQTWRRLFASLRTRSAAAVTRSSLFAKCLEVLSESDTSSGQRVGQFFESARRKQADRLQALRQSEIEEAEIVANKERAAGAIRAARMAREKGTELQEVGSQSPAQVDGTPGSSMPYAAPTPRASLQRMGRFVGSRLRVLAQSGSSAASYDQFDLMARSTSRQWKDAWRRMKEISKTARAVSSDVAQRAKRLTEDDDEDDHQTTNNNATEKPGATSTTASPGASTSDSPVAPLKPHHPSLPSSALSSLTSALTGTPLPTTGGKSSAAASSIAPFVEQATLSQSPEFFPVFLQILPSNTLRGQFSIHHALMDVLDAAQDYVLITNPFLLPPRGIERALLQAGQRGVRVRLILGGKSDTPFMRWSSTHLYHRFLANNIELYEFQPRILHAKTLTVDGIVSSVGSFNLDFLSSHKLLEVSMGMISAPLAQRMEQQFEVDLKDCKQVTLDSLAERNVAQKLLHWLAFHTSRIVYSFLK